MGAFFCKRNVLHRYIPYQLKKEDLVQRKTAIIFPIDTTLSNPCFFLLPPPFLVYIHCEMISSAKFPILSIFQFFYKNTRIKGKWETILMITPRFIYTVLLMQEYGNFLHCDLSNIQCTK
uniref:Uncharacterized protein n=1 Tax=Micrurus corallinus TaxID=54390 RepID=A0A2D4F296_MICCO